MERRNAPLKVPVSKSVCLTCHTKDRSPDYNVKTYFPKVAQCLHGKALAFRGEHLWVLRRKDWRLTVDGWEVAATYDP